MRCPFRGRGGALHSCAPETITLLTENVADIELAPVKVMGIVLSLGMRGLDESNIPTSGATGTPSSDRRYGVFEQRNRP